MKVLITGGSGFIGTHLTEYMLRRGHTLLNIDIASPKIDSHLAYWRQCDILQFPRLKLIFESYAPDWVIHLAARTDINGVRLEEYQVNTDGTYNILKAVDDTPSVKRLIITSSQFVHRPGPMPEDDNDYEPHTIYGKSKVVAEKLVKQFGMNCIWSIIRPTNVWGAWHPRYPTEFWRILNKGLYIHPITRPPVVRCYGYVKTIVWQIERLLLLPQEQVHEQIFYLSDPPIELLTWVDAFSLKLTGRKAHRVPAALVYLLGLLGDFFAIFNIKFPITTSRFHSMTENYLVPLDKTFKVLGNSPYFLEMGVEETVKWLVDYKGFSLDARKVH